MTYNRTAYFFYSTSCKGKMQPLLHSVLFSFVSCIPCTWQFKVQGFLTNEHLSKGHLMLHIQTTHQKTSYLRAKVRSNSTKKPVQVWALALAPSVNTEQQTMFYTDTPHHVATHQVHVTNNIDHAPWYQSKHHANSCLTQTLKHEGFIAVQVTAYK